MGKRLWVAAASAALLCCLALPASATVRWALGNCPTGHLLTNCVVSTATTNVPGLTIRGYSDTATNHQIADAYIATYSGGIGVTSAAGPSSAATAYNSAGQQESTNSPNHAMDNNGNYEMLLFSFTNAVTLREVQLGWYSTDSDISVLAYHGTGTPTLAGRTYGALTSYGWSVVGNYANVYLATTNGHSHSSAINTSSAPLSSSYWLIGAYNSAFGTGLTTTNDYVKVLNAWADVPLQRTPEPASALLLGAALIGMGAVRRRSKRPSRT